MVVQSPYHIQSFNKHCLLNAVNTHTYLQSRNVVSSTPHTTRKAMTDPIADTVTVCMVWESVAAGVSAVVITVMISLK